MSKNITGWSYHINTQQRQCICFHQSRLHRPIAGCALPNPRLGWGGCKQWESGAWQAVHPSKEAKKKKGALVRDNDKGWRKGGMLRVCPCFQNLGVMQLSIPRKKSVLTKQPFPECTHIMPESRSCVVSSGNHQFLHRNSYIPGSLLGKNTLPFKAILSCYC